VEVPEDFPFQDLGMQAGDTVDRVAADNGQVGHPDLLLRALFYERDALHPLRIVGEAPLHVVQELRVDAEDDLEVEREHLSRPPDRPCLERLRQNGVIGVGECADRDVPRRVPVKAFVAGKQTQQFGNGERRVGVVQLYGDLFREEPRIGVLFLETVQDILNRG